MTNAKPTIAITGANGFLGTELTTHFLSKGWRVVALVRNPESIKKQRKNIEYRDYDITQPVSDTTLAGVDYLVHAAYVKLNAKNPDAFHTNIDGAKRLLAAVKKSSIKQSLFISTMSAHAEAISIYGKQKLAIEELFLHTKHATVLRCGLIIGDGGIVHEMATFMKTKHAVPLIGGGQQPLQIIGVSDICAIVENTFKRTLTGRFVAAHPTVYTYRDFYKALAARLDVRVVYIPMPYWVLQTAFRAAAVLHIPLGVGEDNLKGLKKLIAMPSDKDMEVIGITPHSLNDALKLIAIK